MTKFLVILGTLLAGTSALVYFGGRSAGRRIQRMPAAKGAAMLAEAWSDYRTRA